MSWVGVLTQATAPPPLDQVDLLPAATRAAQIEKMEKRLAATFAATKFAGCAMVPVAARPGGPDGAGGAEGLAALTAELTRRVPPPVAMGAPEETKPLLVQQLIVLITLLRPQALQTLILTITLVKEWMLHLYQLQTS